MRKLIVGNWKMNSTVVEAKNLCQALAEYMKTSNTDMVVCPPSILIGKVSEFLQGSVIKVGGQDCHDQPKGAFMGDISAPMLKEAGCAYVITGHSERRQYHRETSELVALKSKAGHEAGLVTIICVGETLVEREAGKARTVVQDQLEKSIPATATVENTVIAYEPVWAIGTGKIPSIADVRDMHAFIRLFLEQKMKEGEKVRILYGGSVKPDNAGEIMRVNDVNGVLVGGASLKAQDFIAIAQGADS